MSFYSEEIIEEVRSRNDIVDVVGSYVQLKRSGARYVGLCPFHNEKTASFSVNRNLQIYKCFGCNKGGNVFSFVMEYESYTFPEAVRFLAERAGMDLPEASEDEDAKRRKGERDRLLEINKEAATYFYRLLRSEHGAFAYRYFSERGLSDETMKRFGLGFAGKYSDMLYKYLKEKGYRDEYLKQTGLVSIDERGGYDRFWNRAIFPIMDLNGKVIGFGGRIMGEPGKAPKYLNSPESPVFDKGRNLYALNIAKSSKRDYILLCEGYMDVIALHQAGFDNAVASLGTALTENQAKLISRYVKKAVITYDSDGAGTKAALRAIPILKAAGLSVKILNMKPYKDPDEFIKALGAEEYQKRVDEAVNAFYFEVERLLDGKDPGDPDVKTNFAHDIAEKLARIRDDIERDTYLDAVSKRYGIKSELLRSYVNRIGRDVLMSDAMKEKREQERRENKLRETGFVPRIEEPALGAEEPRTEDRPEAMRPDGGTSVQQDAEGTRTVPQGRMGSGSKGKLEKLRDEGLRQSERILLTYLANNESSFRRISGLLSAEDFADSISRLVAGMVFDQYSRDGHISPARIVSSFEDADEQSYVAGIFTAKENEELDDAGGRKAFADTVIKVKESSLKRAFSAAAAAGDTALLSDIMKRQKELPGLKQKLQNGD